MYLDHFGLTEAPFKITPHTEFFFDGAKRGETLDALIYAIMAGEGIVKVTGEVGAGKTMLCRVLMERLPDNVETIYLAVPTLTRDEMLAVIAEDLDIAPQGISTTKLIRELQQRLIDMHAEGKHVVAIIDEAHAMPLTTLEELRLLSNLETNQSKLLQIVMFGQPELNQHLMLPSMRQLKERVTHSFNLLPLPAGDIKDYLDFRLRAAGYKGPALFTPETLKVIADASEGLTRRINIYADKALLAAYADNTHTVTVTHVRTAIADTQIGMVPLAASQPASIANGLRQYGLIAATLVAGLLIGVSAMYFWGNTRFSAAPSNDALSAVAHPVPKSDLPVIPPVDPINTLVVSEVAHNEVAHNQVVNGTVKAASISTPTPSAAPTSPASHVIAPASVAAPVPASPAPVVIKPPSPPAPASKTAPAPALAPVPLSGWLETRLAEDKGRIAAFAGTRYTMQLMIAEQERNRDTNDRAIRQFWNEAAREINAGPLMMYPRGSQEKPSIGIIYGDFESQATADAAIEKLSERLKKYRPYARSFNVIRNEMRP